MRRLLAAVAMSLTVTCTVVALSGARTPATATTTRPADASSGSFSATETVTRDNLVDGQDQVVDTRTVTLNVNETQNLQGRQEIDVSWSGAHPTAGIVADQNSAAADQEEYPFVLLECRGTDSAADPITPETCWTQTWSEHYQDSLDDQYPAYRLDRYATSSPTPAIVGAPSTLPASCQFDETAPVQDWVPFVAASGQVYYGGNAGCAGEPPESDDVGGSALPSNETFGVTGTDGTGSADFDVWTSAENASLGCSQTVACSLVAVPIMGISCEVTSTTPAADASACEDTGAFAPGASMPGTGGGELAVQGSLWWSPSNWRNRISVPLTFATPASACSVVSSPSTNIIDVYGSELMIQATGQWEPYFCSNPNSSFSFVHVQTGEPQSRNLVATGSAEAAFTSYAQPGGYGKPVVNAPVGVTGFAISYDIDGGNGQPYTSLKLTPLLLAKLLTESYPADLPVQEEDAALAHNPINITEDPEFQALNPGITPNVLGYSEAASVLVAMSGDSDVMEALTTYINDDPTARAWLNGTPDKTDGEDMVVNPAYEGIQLPVDQWPLLSTFEPTAWYQSDANDCLYNDPVPFQPLVAAPLASLEDISESMQYALPNSTTVCSESGASTGEKLVTQGRQAVGHQFMIGITPLADNQRYQLQSAALQTTPGTFVAPTDASVQAATTLLTPDASTGTWPIPYTEFEQPAGAAAYPGAMIVYAAVPTTGLPKTDAADYASLLQFAATTGQTEGFGAGQLPPGYLPMTSANGLGALANYTLAAAADVAAQNGQVPPLTAVASTTTKTSTTSSSSSASSSAFPPVSPHSGTTGDDANGSYPTGSTDSTASGSKSGASHKATRRLPFGGAVSSILRLGSALGIALWTGGGLIVFILSMGMFGLLGVPATYLLGRRRGKW